MKKLLILTSIVSTAFIQNLEASPFLPHLGPIRTEIVNQQVIVSNTAPLNKPLATALRKALLQIDRPTPTNLVNDTKALSSIAGTLNKTSLSNTFDPLIRTALGNYVGVLGASLHSLSNSLASTFPSGPHTAANKLIAAAFDSIEAVIANGNTTLATKGLAAAVKKLPAIQNLLTKAQNAPAPKASITMDVIGAVHYSNLKTLAAVIAHAAGANYNVNGATKPSAHGFIQVAFSLYGVAEGTSTVNIQGCDFAIVSVGGKGFVGPSGDVNGTATVTYNSATKIMFGTFTFTAHDENNPSSMITVTGSFSGTAIQ